MNFKQVNNIEISLFSKLQLHQEEILEFPNSVVNPFCNF